MYQKKIKKCLASVMVCVLAAVVTMTGCDQQPAGEPAAESVRINSPVEISYLMTNPIDVDIEDIADGDNGQFSSVKVTVTGMADESLQQEINSTIAEAIDAMKGAAPPPYRGIKVKLGDNPKMIGEWINAFVTMNANNILSMYIMRNVTYEEYCISDMIPLNFDLNTGRQITIKDVFCDDVDYMDYVNDSVSKQLIDAHAEEEGFYEGYLGMTLTGPYKGISDTQKFYLDQNTGNLNLVFDYETPEVDTNWYYVTLPVPFENNAAYTKRFMTGENIYTYDGPEQKQLLTEDLMLDHFDEISHDQPRTNLYVYSSVRYSSEMPKELQELAGSFAGIDGEMQDFVAEKYDDYAAKYGEDCIWGSYEANVYSGKTSKYWYIAEGMYMCVSNNTGDATESFATSLAKYHTYEEGSSDELTIYDIFSKDANSQKLIKSAIKIQLEETEALKDVAIKQDLLDMLFENINGFYLSNDCISLSYGDISGLLLDYGIEEEKQYDYFGAVESVKYKNVGCENLTIFD